MRKAVPLALLLLLAGCAKGRESLVVGSKPFTESEIVGEMIALLAEEKLGVPVDRRFYIGGTLCFQSLRTGDLDIYVEYTGTGLVNILKAPVMKDPAKVYEKVKREFKKRWDLVWLKPFGFNNTYTLMMRRRHAEREGIRRISQLKGYRKKLRCGFDLEFYDRPDGYRGMIEHYGMDFCNDIKQMDAGLMYQALADKQVDVICGYATDGRVKALDLSILDDDLKFFPPYYAAPLARPKAFRKAPGLRELLGRLGGRISDAAMTRLNAEVDSEKRGAREVAREFLVQQGLL